jgi:hypothetical protein
MSSKNRQQPPTSSPRTAYIIMAAGALAVVALVGWALSRSFSEPVHSTLAVDTAPAAAPSTSFEVPKNSPDEASVARIEPQDLRQKMLRGEVTVLDVRSADDYRLAHLPGSMHVPLANVEAQIAYLPKGKPIVTYCT